MTTLNSGIPAVGNISWGTHFCQFYHTQNDLIETLIPFFEAGLSGNESCLWVTSEHLDADIARTLLADAIPELDKYLASGQMEIISISDWYTAGDKFDADTVLQGWINKEADSKARGFTGLRLTGDTFWVERSGWNDFMDYENKVNEAFRRYNLVALCTYHMDKCSAEDVIDVCCNHQFALARRKGTWELLESSSLKIAKDSLNKLNSELESRVEQRTKELNVALQARDEFLAMLGHELRNPLAPIRSATEVIRALTPSSSPISASTAILDRQVHHITRLVDDLLDVGRITQGQIQLHLKATSLADIIEQAVELTRPFIDSRNQSLGVSLPSRHLKVNVDPARLAQVFGNLLHNAAKYTPDGGSVSIVASAEDDVVAVDIIDNGAGIPNDMLSHIFDLFTQLPRSLARSDGGLGIGLTLVKRIAEMHQGTVEAFSDGVGQGSRFTVRLPVYGEQTKVAEIAKIQTGHSSRGMKILIVDDNIDSNESLSMLLSLSGYNVKTAADGVIGISLAEAFMPEVILLDIGLPGLNGYEVAQRLKQNPKTSGVHLIAVTGYGNDNDVQLAKEAGFDAHLLKPARLDDILNLIGPVAAANVQKIR